MAEKEREVQLLRKQLQVRELELARLKLTSLREAPIQSGISETVSQPTSAVGDYAGELSFKNMQLFLRDLFCRKFERIFFTGHQIEYIVPLS